MNAQRFLMGLGIVVCLAASAGLWYWAVVWPKPADGLAEDYRGRFVLFQYEPGEEGGQDPFSMRQRWEYEFTADNQFIFRVFIDGNFIMAERAGLVTEEKSWDGEDRLVLRQHTVNGVATEGEPCPRSSLERVD